MTKHNIFIDLETYYDTDYSLSKMTTAEYVHDSRFETIMACYAIDDGPIQFLDGLDKHQLALLLKALPWEDATLVAHNAIFDGYVLAKRYGIYPEKYFCTMMASRPNVVPFSGSMSLAKVTDYMGLGTKGGYVSDMKGVYRAHMRPHEVMNYRAYCELDVEIMRKIHRELAPQLPPAEHELIDSTIRKFTRPQLLLDKSVLRTRLAEIQQEKEDVLVETGLSDPAVLRSNEQFAQVLMTLGVSDPPQKISPTTGEPTWAFAKSDAGMRELLEHEDEKVQAVAAARLRHKSTIEEARIERFLLQPDLLPVPLLYYGAHTGRYSGLDKLNMQNLPVRGGAVALRRALTAPEGYKVVAADLSQIEARIAVTVAGEANLRDAFAAGEDVYKRVASRIYEIPIEEVTPAQRFIGKQCVLALNYGMGVDKFMDTMRIAKNPIDRKEANRIVYGYRENNSSIPDLWRISEQLLDAMAAGRVLEFPPLATGKDFLRLPNGMVLRYPDLKLGPEGYTYEGTVGRARVRKKIYGGKLVENFTQALARIVISEVELALKKYGLHAALQVHDELVYVVKDEHVEKVVRALYHVMRRSPHWLPDLPVDCEVGVGQNYAEAH